MLSIPIECILARLLLVRDSISITELNSACELVAAIMPGIIIDASKSALMATCAAYGNHFAWHEDCIVRTADLHWGDMIGRYDWRVPVVCRELVLETLAMLNRRHLTWHAQTP